MGGEIIVFGIVFGTIFGIAYLFFTTRNRERIAMIESGKDANLFVKDKRGRTIRLLKMVFLNVALVVIGIGTGIFVGAMIAEMGVHPDIAFPGAIFSLAGLGLYFGFVKTHKMELEERNED